MDFSDITTDIENIAFAYPANDQQWFEGVTMGLTQEDYQTLDEGRMRVVSHMMANAFRATANSIKNYNLEITRRLVAGMKDMWEETAEHDEFLNLKTLVETDNGLLMTLNSNVANLTTQLQQLPLNQGQGSSRQPKIGEPPEFNGTDGKVKFNEWLNKLSLWFVHESVSTDRQRIAVAMNRLSGAAAQYMEPWIKKLTMGQTIGTWDEFVD